MPVGEPARHRAPYAGSDEKRGHRDDRRDDGESAGTSDAEAEQDDVAGHVRGEHVAEAEVADGIDGARREGQRKQGE